MATINFGVVDIPYSDKHGTTTGDVAGWLEDRYHLMEVFLEDTGGIAAIAKAFEESAQQAIENIQLGSTAQISLTAQAETDIETEFRHYLSQQRFDGVIPGVPTQAAFRGVNHRLARPYAQDNPERASFIDTGLYQSSFKVWTEE
jgi:hypothetical protein